jgi:putative Mg2+ transporter-C (MgtC) family protein
VGLIPPILLATLLGALVGLEREIHGHPAGLRTHILVALGSTLVTLVSVSMADYGSRGGDPGRIASQIVTGIGFLGAGAIIREGANIRGLTTAASIWATAMVGIAVGVSPRMAFLGSVTTVLCLLVLWWLHRVEEAMERRGLRDRVLDVHISETPQATSEVFTALMESGTSVEGVTMETVRGSSGRRLFVRVRLKAGQDPSALIARLIDLPGVRSVAWQ